MSQQFTAPITRAMLLAAETYDGERLHDAGVVHRIGGLDEAMAWATEISAMAPLSIAAHKLALERSGPTPPSDPLAEQARDMAWASADAVEGRAAFLAKRPATFTGTLTTGGVQHERSCRPGEPDRAFWLDMDESSLLGQIAAGSSRLTFS